MTLMSVRNALISHFCHADIFKGSDIPSIQVPKGLTDHREGLVRAALAELTDAGIIRCIGPRDNVQNLAATHPSAASDLWILSSPLGAMGQDVHISLNTADGIADTINTWLEGNGLPGERTDPLNINEGHIISILNILNDILSTDPDPPAGGLDDPPLSGGGESEGGPNMEGE